MIYVGEEALRRAAGRGWLPDPRLSVSEWADAHRFLSGKSSAEPGPWRTARTPYLREIMDCLSTDSPIDEVVLMKGAQLGGSEAINNVLGYAIDHSPGPIMIVQPTVDTAKRYSRQRIDPLIGATPRLRGKVASVRSRDSANTMLQKDFEGGTLVITGANSAVGLRSMPVRWLLLDEIDGYPDDVDGEGAPVELAEARTRTFVRRKVIKVSTPTIAEVSPIEKAYEASDQRRYFVPCPLCGVRQSLSFKALKWRELGLPAEQVQYQCASCEGLFGEQHKTAMLEAGAWQPTAESSRPTLRGYHLSALYSPAGWLSWADIARQHDLTHASPIQYRVFKNTVLGQTWKIATLAADWQALYRRREDYKIGTAPSGVCVITCGVDVQKDYLVYEVVGWGRGLTSWSIEWGTLLGDTADEARGPWAQLDDLLARRFPAGGTPLTIARLAIDMGYHTPQVYKWARRYPVSRVIAVRGYPGQTGLLIGVPRALEVARGGKQLKHGFKHWPVYGHVVKDELFGFLGLEVPPEGAPPPGYCHFPMYDTDYFQQLTAEHLVPVKGSRGFVYEQIAGRANHALDARVYARAAAEALGLSRFTEARWKALEVEVGAADPNVAGFYDDEVPD